MITYDGFCFRVSSPSLSRAHSFPIHQPLALLLYRRILLMLVKFEYIVATRDFAMAFNIPDILLILLQVLAKSIVFNSLNPARSLDLFQRLFIIDRIFLNSVLYTYSKLSKVRTRVLFRFWHCGLMYFTQMARVRIFEIKGWRHLADTSSFAC